MLPKGKRVRTIILRGSSLDIWKLKRMARRRRGTHVLFHGEVQLHAKGRRVVLTNRQVQS